MADTSGSRQGGISSAAVLRATGRSWDDWFAMLDKAGAKDRDHASIAAWLAGRPGSPGGWWCQMITVAYEQARGLREKHQKPDGYSVSVSRTLAAPVAALYRAWTDARLRSRWLGGSRLTITTKTPGKSVRIRWDEDATRVDVNLYAKGAGKSQVALQHEKLPDAQSVERQRAFWKERLGALAKVLAAGPAKPGSKTKAKPAARAAGGRGRAAKTSARPTARSRR